jgi:hypothetical protein
VVLLQCLPEPTSSQVGMSIGIFQADVLGSVLAWRGCPLPSALALAAFADGLQIMGGADAGWLRGLKVVEVAVRGPGRLGDGPQFDTGLLQRPFSRCPPRGALSDASARHG